MTTNEPVPGLADGASLGGRTALVTGASRGIGAAVAKLLARWGARVAIDHAGDREAASALVDDIVAGGGVAVAYDVDVARTDVATALVARVALELGPVDVLVINAARTLYAKLEDMDEAMVDAHLEVNFKATLRLLNATVPGMASRGFGRVVAIGSINQESPIPILPVYGALKSAQHNLMRGLARRWSARGVTFNSVSPGLIRTDRNAWRREPGGDWDALSQSCSYMGRAGTPEEVAWIVAMVCAPGAAYVTGENIHVAGGAQIPGPRDVGED